MLHKCSIVSNLLFIVAFMLLSLYSAGYRVITLSSFSATMSTPFIHNFQCLPHRNKNKKLVYIPTASFAYREDSNRPKGLHRRRSRYEAKQKMKFLSTKLNMDTSQMIELDNPKIKDNFINEALTEATVVYVDGGNTFYLQKCMQDRDFWKTMIPELKSGCIYIGASAGAIVAGKSIHPAYWKGWDDPTVVGDEYIWTKERLQGANLCGDCSLFMHYEEEKHRVLVHERSMELEKNHVVRTISDSEVVMFTQECHNGVKTIKEYLLSH